MRRVIALLRVSSEAQASPDRMGLPAQQRVCERVAQAHDLEIIDWVELEGVSGAAVLADPRFGVHPGPDGAFGTDPTRES